MTQCFNLLSDPPRRHRLVQGATVEAQPRGARRGGVTCLLGRVEDLFDAPLAARAAPGAQKAADGIDVENLLERQRDFRSHHRRQRQRQHRIFHRSIHRFAPTAKPIVLWMKRTASSFQLVHIRLRRPRAPGTHSRFLRVPVLDRYLKALCGPITRNLRRASTKSTRSLHLISASP